MRASRRSPASCPPSSGQSTFWAVDAVYNDTTDLHAYRDESDPYADVRVWDYNYGNNGYYAWIDCPSDNTGTSGSHPNRTCRGQAARFNTWYYFNASVYDTEYSRQSLACHELGHTVGLRHLATNPTDARTCMYTYVGSDPYRFLGTHSRNHVDAQY